MESSGCATKGKTSTKLEGRPAWLWHTELVLRSGDVRYEFGVTAGVCERAAVVESGGDRVVETFESAGAWACECEGEATPSSCVLAYAETSRDLEPFQHDLWECPKCGVVVTRLDATPELFEGVVYEGFGEDSSEDIDDDAPPIEGAEDLLHHLGTDETHGVHPCDAAGGAA